jgi:MFS family permease
MSADHSLLRQRAFVQFWIARVSTTVALQMMGVAVGWQIYELTGSALDLGLVGLFQFVPALLLLLVAGHFADRYDRRRIIAAAEVMQAAAVAVLAVGAGGGWMTRELILATVFMVGAGRAFEAPTMSALLPRLVPLPMLSRAVAVSSAAHQAAAIAGPALGGVLYYYTDATFAYAAASALYAAASILMLLIRSAPVETTRKPTDLRMFFAGITFIRHNPVVLGAISLDLFAVLLGGVTALLPIFARDILAVGPDGLGLLRASPGIGALLISVFLARWRPRRRVGHVMFTAVAGFGVATVVFGVSRSFPLSCLALAVLGAMDMVSVVIRQTLVQLHTPDSMRGRVNSVNTLFVGTSNQLGDFRAGLTAALVGAVPSALIGGIGTLLVVLIWMRVFPALLDVASLEAPQPVKTPLASADRAELPPGASNGRERQ